MYEISVIGLFISHFTYSIFADDKISHTEFIAYSHTSSSVKSKRYSGEHWQYDETIKYTVENNDALDEYHRKLPGFYMEQGKSMTDEDLDFVIYGYVVAKSA